MRVWGRSSAPLVVVASDGVQRCVLPKLVHDFLPVDVPSVEDGVGGLQASHHFRPQQAVGVRENGNVHRLRPPYLNDEALAVVDLMLDDLGCPAGEGFQPLLKLLVLPAHLDGTPPLG